MEGMFAFLLESAFVGALVWGEKRLGPRKHFLAAVAVAVGSWLSGYFILVTSAFMQHPVGHVVAADGTLAIGDMRAYLLNPWALVQFAHNQAAALVTGTFVVTAVGAFYALREVTSRSGADVPQARNRGRTCRGGPRGVPDRGLAGQDRRPLPGAGARRDGGPLRNRADGGDHAHRAAERQGTSHRQPDQDSRRAQLPRVWHVPQRCPGTGCISAGHLAHQHRAPLLRLPRHGRARHDVHRVDGTGQHPAPPRTTGTEPCAPLGVDARLPVSVHREHRRLDDDGAGPPTLADLRAVSHAGRLQRRRQLRRCAVHADRDGGTVLRARPPVSVSRRARDPARS